MRILRGKSRNKAWFPSFSLAASQSPCLHENLTTAAKTKEMAALFLILAVLLGYDAMRESLPDTMYVDENSESPFQPLTKHPLLTISEDTKEAEKTEFGETGETVVECSAAGIPLKKIRVIQEDGEPYSRNPFVRRNRQPSVRKYSAGRRLYHKSKRTEHPQQAGAD